MKNINNNNKKKKMKKEKEKKKEEENNPTLPAELIVEILLRAPVKSLLRFKSVCKVWNFLISQPRFAQMHFDLAAASKPRILVNLTTKGKVDSVDIGAPLHHDSSITKLSIAALPHRAKIIASEILCSCRGFVLLVNYEGDLFVWNPATRFQVKVPDSIEFMFDYLRGIWYDPSTDDYFVVIITLDLPDMNPKLWFPLIEFYSFKTNSTCRIEDINLRYKDISYEFRSGLYLNGALHWLVISVDTNLHVILTFNLLEEGVLSEIHLSRDLITKLAHKKYYLRVMGECLSLCYPGEKDNSAMPEIWVMKEYKVQSSWTKLFVLSAFNIPRRRFFLIYFTDCGEIIGSDGHGRIVKVNDKGELLESRKFKLKLTYVLLHYSLYRESLFSLPCHIEESSEDGASEDQAGEDESSEDETSEDEASGDETSEDETSEEEASEDDFDQQ